MWRYDISLEKYSSVKSDAASEKGSAGSQQSDKQGSKVDGESQTMGRRTSLKDTGENGKHGNKRGSVASSLDIPPRGDSRMSRQSRSDSVQSRVTIQDPKDPKSQLAAKSNGKK